MWSLPPQGVPHPQTVILSSILGMWAFENTLLQANGLRPHFQPFQPPSPTPALPDLLQDSVLRSSWTVAPWQQGSGGSSGFPPALSQGRGTHRVLHRRVDWS